jgi:hypothetical protein
MIEIRPSMLTALFGYGNDGGFSLERLQELGDTRYSSEASRHDGMIPYSDFRLKRPSVGGIPNSTANRFLE